MHDKPIVCGIYGRLTNEYPNLGWADLVMLGWDWSLQPDVAKSAENAGAAIARKAGK